MDRSRLVSFHAYELMENAETTHDDGLKSIAGFPVGSFDKILLDPPCSALGLRPKLFVAQQSLRELEKHASYQRKFADQAVKLLKPGGYMTYSTCTINSSENEGVVNYILNKFPCMELVPIEVARTSEFGSSGLAGCGLNDEQRNMVRRFDPSDCKQDTMGFFIARLLKQRIIE